MAMHRENTPELSSIPSFCKIAIAVGLESSITLIPLIPVAASSAVRRVYGHHDSSPSGSRRTVLSSRS